MDLFSPSISPTAVQNITLVWHIRNNMYLYTRTKCLLSSGAWRCVAWYLCTENSEKHAASNIRVTNTSDAWFQASATKVDENYALLGHYAARSGNILPTFRDNLFVPSTGLKNFNYYAAGSGSFLQTFRDNLSVSSTGFKSLIITQRVVVISCRRLGTTYRFYPQASNPEYGTNGFSRNVGKKLPLFTE